MKIAADTHTHTIASTHAYSTIEEMINAAAKEELYAIAITDHSRTMPGAPGMWYFENLRAIPNVYNGVRVLKGIEANIIDYKGNIDVDDYLQNTLDWIVASVHSVTISEEPSVELCTEMYLKAADNPHITVFGHSGTPEYTYDYDVVIPKIAQSGKLIEINNSTFKFKKGSMKNCFKIAKLCKKYGARIIINSDAHFSASVGKVDNAIEALKEIDFPKELIVNSSKERFIDYLKERNIALK